MIKAPPTPKGFRDIAPTLAKRRREVIGKIVSILEEFEFVPIETPTIEFAQTLEGKYGEEERLIYKFTDRGGRKLALRFDLTVPLARYVATYNPPLPFRRYQIGQVFRGENPQRGRWREFTQLDFDSVGSSDPEEDAKVIASALEAMKNLGLSGYSMRINDRKIFEDYDLSVEAIRALDKVYKNKEGPMVFIKQLIREGKSNKEADYIFNKIVNTEETIAIKKLFSLIEKMGFQKGRNYQFWFDPTLARGLDYYTSFIFEMRAESYGMLSIGGGGRYDNLIGMFAKKDLPAVGFSFGLDRLLEILYP